jgi:proteic killer suppression protein
MSPRYFYRHRYHLWRHTGDVIQSFNHGATYNLFKERKSRRWSNIAEGRLQKLDQVEAAAGLADVQAPPGNRIEALRGGRKGQHSIQV